MRIMLSHDDQNGPERPLSTLECDFIASARRKPLPDSAVLVNREVRSSGIKLSCSRSCFAESEISSLAMNSEMTVLPDASAIHRGGEPCHELCS